MTGKQLRNSILQWAIQGKLVPQDPNDEPASVLLERIRAEKARLVKEKKIKKDKNESIIYRGEDNSYYEKFLATGEVKCIDDEIPFDIPQGWEWCRLALLIFPPKYGTSKKSKPSGSLPVLRMGNIQDGEVIFDKLVYSNDLYDNKRLLLKYGDLLFNRTNSAELVGKTAIFRGQRDAIFAGYIILLRPIFISSEYLNFVLNTPYARAYCNDVKTIGVQQCNINAEKISNLLIPIPHLNETVRIEETIRNLTLPIKKYEELNRNLKFLNNELPIKLRKTILQAAIQGRLVPQIESEGTAEELLEEIRAEKKRLVKEGKLKASALKEESRIFRGEDNKYYLKDGNEILDFEERLFPIPDTWRWVTLGELIVDSTGLSYKKEDLTDRSNPQVRVLRGGNIEDGNMIFKDDDVFISCKFVPQELFLKEGVFITPAVSSLEKIGKTAVVKRDFENVVVGGFVLMLTPTFSNPFLRQYLYHIFQSAYYHNYCKDITKKSGQAFYNLSRQKLKQFPVPLPPEAEIPRILIQLEKALASIMSR